MYRAAIGARRGSRMPDRGPGRPDCLPMTMAGGPGAGGVRSGIEVSGVRRAFGDVLAVDDISLDGPAG